MSMQGPLSDAVILLGAAVIFVPIAQKLGLGSVLGYLLAGVLVGPATTGWIHDSESLLHVSELGVVFLLFVIGLELDPKRLWSWRLPIFGMGTAQVVGVAAVFTGSGVLLGFPWTTSLAAGLALSLSSTAIAVQIMKDRNLMGTPAGSSAFSVLLFQDIAVIPILSLLPLLGQPPPGVATQTAPLWLIFGVIALVIVVGHFFFRHVLRLVASVHLREIFTVFCLLLVMGLAAIMQSIGISMGLGAFLGGVLLANSEYRHAIETDLEPFKGLLLGLFFMSVGMSLDLLTIQNQPLVVLGLVVALLTTKAAIHAGLAFAFGMNRKQVPLFSVLIAQGGEFAFVLFGISVSYKLLSSEQSSLLSAAVVVSMALAPLMMIAYDRWIAPSLARRIVEIDETIEDDNPEVIIAGFGRVGQVIGRLLYANQIRATVLDHDPSQIETLRRFGFKIYYGDATRSDLLHTAGASKAKILVVAIDDVDDGLQVVDMAKEHFPHLRIIARARNVRHVYELMDRGVEVIERETFDGSLRMGASVLERMGWRPYQAVRACHRFRDHNLELLNSLHADRKNEAFVISQTRQAREDLEKMFAGEEEFHRREDDGWDLHPDRG